MLTRAAALEKESSSAGGQFNGEMVMVVKITVETR